MDTGVDRRTEWSHWLRCMRARRGLTQVEAAWAIGVSPGAVGHWESGVRRSPKYAELVKVVRFFRQLPPELDRALHGGSDGTASV